MYSSYSEGAGGTDDSHIIHQCTECLPHALQRPSPHSSDIIPFIKLIPTSSRCHRRQQAQLSPSYSIRFVRFFGLWVDRATVINKVVIYWSSSEAQLVIKHLHHCQARLIPSQRWWPCLEGVGVMLFPFLCSELLSLGFRPLRQPHASS